MTHYSPPAATEFNRRAFYLTMLNEQLERRQRDHGRAFLSPEEEAWLRTRGLRQSRRYADIRQLEELDSASARNRSHTNA